MWLPFEAGEPSEGRSFWPFPGLTVRLITPLSRCGDRLPPGLAATVFGGGRLGNRVGGDRSRAPKRFAQVIEEVAQEG